MAWRKNHIRIVPHCDGNRNAVVEAQHPSPASESKASRRYHHPLQNHERAINQLIAAESFDGGAYEVEDQGEKSCCIERINLLLRAEFLKPAFVFVGQE